MKRILKFILKETIKIIPVVIFFILTFNLIVLSEKLMLKHHLPSYFTFTLATITALIVGKCLIIVNSLPFIDAFPHKPLIYNISWKFFIYGIFIFLFRMIDKAIHAYVYEGKTTLVYVQLKNILTSSTFWAIQIWMLMVFLIYIVAAEFTRVLGKEKVKSLLFGSDK